MCEVFVFFFFAWNNVLEEKHEPENQLTTVLLNHLCCVASDLHLTGKWERESAMYRFLKVENFTYAGFVCICESSISLK